jgi:hypothetical protein
MKMSLKLVSVNGGSAVLIETQTMRSVTALLYASYVHAFV